MTDDRRLEDIRERRGWDPDVAYLLERLERVEKQAYLAQMQADDHEMFYKPQVTNYWRKPIGFFRLTMGWNLRS